MPFMGDGCLMEGISHEACSLAGTLGLGKLVAFWDDNGISIDGEVEGWFSDDTPARFKAYGWHVISGVDGHDSDAVSAAIAEAKSVTDKPSLICCKTIIGYGSPNKSGSHDCHGAPLGDDEIKASREFLGWTGEAFEIPADIYAQWDRKRKRVNSLNQAGMKSLQPTQTHTQSLQLNTNAVLTFRTTGRLGCKVSRVH